MSDVGDHYRATTDDDASGVYRVVGARETITLVRVTDADGTREHTGELVTVDAAALDDRFEPAADPDAGLTPIRDLRNLLSGLYWSIRRFF